MSGTSSRIYLYLEAYIKVSSSFEIESEGLCPLVQFVRGSFKPQADCLIPFELNACLKRTLSFA